MPILVLVLLIGASIAGTAFAQRASFGDVFPMSHTRYGPVHGGTPLLRTRSPIRVAAALVLTLLSSGVAAQQWQFGAPFPLTNTRYGETWGKPILLENDSGTFLFWATPEGVRVTKIIPGERRGGRVVLETLQSSGFDVIWTGKHFFVAAGTSRGADEGIVGQLLDENAEKVGGARVLAEQGTTPRLALSKSAALLVFKKVFDVVANFLTLEGVPTGVIHSFKTSYSFSRSQDVASNGSSFAIAAGYYDSMQTIVLDESGAIAITAVNSGGRPEFIAVESNGTDYLVAYGSSTTKMRRLRTDGELEGILEIEGSSGAPSIAWNGNEYVVAYSHAFPLGLSIAHVDRDVRQVLSTETKEERNVGNPSVIARGERVRVAYGSPVSVTDLPFEENEPAVVTYAAVSQKLLAAASSNDATLAVWDEGELHIGVRTSDGRWRERTFSGLGGTFVLAASDGGGFVFFAYDTATPTYPLPVFATFADPNGVPRSDRVELPCFPLDVVWTGDAYAIVGIHRDQLLATLLKPSGELSEPVSIAVLESLPSEPLRAAIATDGEGFLVVWEKHHWSYFPPFVEYSSLSAFLLDGSLRKTGSELEVADEGRWPAAAWRNGSYTIAFATEAKDVRTRVLTNGTFAAPSVIHAGANLQRDVRIAMIGNEQWISWLDPYDAAFATSVHRIVSDSGSFAFRSGTLTAPLVVPMPGGRVAYVATPTQPLAPHHGRPHVMMAVADRVAPWRLNDTPVMIARHENQVINLEWTSTSPNADGYRVEYRIGDGSWNELNRWFDPDERSTAFFPLRSGVLYSFRVRGWSEGGTGPYSEPAVVYTGRRRAVR